MSDVLAEIDLDALAPGSRLGEFEIVRVLGIGGFGIVYLAFDHALERHVAVKEYMPATLAARRSGAQVAVRSQAHTKTFDIGLRSFVNEARLLARFDHAALVKVYRFWEDNGTAYMAMRYYEGQTLGGARAAMGSPPNEAWLLALADAVLGALEALHREQVYHRDVAPDNILLQPDGNAVLLDFGAARHVIGDHTQSLTAILKPNFAPIEQYADSSLLRQGPWSDIYSLGAVLYFCLIGRAPVPAALRVLDDELPSLRALRQELVAADGSHYSEALLGAIDAALAVRPEARPQDVAALRAALHGEVQPLPAGVIALPAPPQAASPEQRLRAAFAPTDALRRRLGMAPAVTTAWATLGPREGEAHAEAVPRGGRGAGLGARLRAGLSWRVAPLWNWVVPALASLVFVALIGYSATRPGEPARPGVVPEQAATVPAQRAAAIRTQAAQASAAAVETAVPAVAPAAAGRATAPAPTGATARRATRAPSPAADAARVEVRSTPAIAEAESAVAAVEEDEPPRRERVLQPARAKAHSLTARESCGERNFFSMQFCLQRQCSKPAFERDAECTEMRERAQQRLF